MAVNAALPLYAQIAAELRAQIERGEYRPGAAIPSEHELARAFSVGRPTVRQATQLLVDESVLERRQGSGTYVSQPPQAVDLFSAAGTLAAFRERGVALETRVLGRARECAVSKDAENPFAGQRALAIRRESAVSGIPVLFEEMLFDREVFNGLDKLSLSGRSLSDLARERYSLHLTSAEQRFRLHELGAPMLGLETGSTVLLVERTLSFVGAPRAVFARLFCRTDQFAFSQTIRFAPHR